MVNIIKQEVIIEEKKEVRTNMWVFKYYFKVKIEI